MKVITLKRISIQDPEYIRVRSLRDEVLRRPLGLSLNDEDLSSESAEQIIIARHGENVIGCLMLRPLSATELKLRQMAVAESFRGEGIGNRLLKEAESFAREQGFRHITLHARMVAVPFYELNGYTANGDVFTEVGIPHLLMEKTLS